MKCFLIATVRSANDNIEAYVIFDSESKDKAKNKILVTEKQLIQALIKTPDLVKNLALVNDKIAGTNGKLDRYPRVNAAGNLLPNTKSPMIVLNRIGNVGYTVVDYKGQVMKLPNDKVVEYAKNQGIANGKVVVKDSIEFISSITEEYEVVNIAPSKAGANTKVNIPIHIDSDVQSVAKHTSEDIETEMEYNDVFKAMTTEQRNILKQYYTWYTVDEYKKMAKNVRLDLAPGKAEKLSQLRGIDKWQFAGINDSYMEGNFKAHCELGHRLRYEYFAIPEQVAEEMDNLKTRDRVGYNRVKRDRVQDLRDNGAIVFGETCAGDFFNISKEDMQKLVKTRKTMSEEIELMSGILTNHTEPLYTKKAKLLYQVIQKLGSAENVAAAFGDDVGYTLLAFIQTKMPFPMSLVILAADKVCENTLNFYKLLFPEYSKILVELEKNKLKIAANNDIKGLTAANCLLDFIARYNLEGDYKYDPLTDKDGIRKDIGKYNKETREKRQCEVSSLILSTSVNVEYLNDISTIETYLKVLTYTYQLAFEAERLFNNTEYLKEKYNTISDYVDAKHGEYSAISLYDIPEEEKDEFIAEKRRDAFILNIKNFISASKGYKLINDLSYQTRVNKKDSSGVVKSVEKTVYRYSYNRSVTFYQIISYRYRAGLSSWKNITEILNFISELATPADTLAANILLGEDTALKEQRQLELNKTYYYMIFTRYDFYDNTGLRAVALKQTYDEKQKLFEMIKEKEDCSIDTDDGQVKLNLNTDLRSIDEVSEEEYNSLLERNNRIREQQAAEKEKEALAEQTRLQALAEQQKKEEAERIRQEEADEAKANRIKELIAKHPDIKSYGIETSKAILEHNIPYSKMSTKQRWRIDTTIKELEALEEREQEQALKESNNATDAANTEDKNKYVIDGIDYDLDNIDLTLSSETETQTNTRVDTSEPKADKEDKAGNTSETEADSIETETEALDNSEAETKEEANKEEASKEEASTNIEYIIPTLKLAEKNNLSDYKIVKDMVDVLLEKIKISDEKRSAVKFATQVAYTVNRTNKFSPKQYNYISKGYKEYIEDKAKNM